MITVEDVARVAHEANLTAREVLMEEAGLPWEELSESTRHSLIAAVVAHFAMSRLPTPAESHEAWCKSRLAGGWQFGAVYDSSTKHHPDLVPFAQLGAASRMKTVTFLAVMRLARKVDRGVGVTF